MAPTPGAPRRQGRARAAGAKGATADKIQKTEPQPWTGSLAQRDGWGSGGLASPPPSCPLGPSSPAPFVPRTPGASGASGGLSPPPRARGPVGTRRPSSAYVGAGLMVAPGGAGGGTGDAHFWPAAGRTQGGRWRGVGPCRARPPRPPRSSPKRRARGAERGVGAHAQGRPCGGAREGRSRGGGAPGRAAGGARSRGAAPLGRRKAKRGAPGAPAPPARPRSRAGPGGGGGTVAPPTTPREPPTRGSAADGTNARRPARACEPGPRPWGPTGCQGRQGRWTTGVGARAAPVASPRGPSRGAPCHTRRLESCAGALSRAPAATVARRGSRLARVPVGAPPKVLWRPGRLVPHGSPHPQA